MVDKRNDGVIDFNAYRVNRLNESKEQEEKVARVDEKATLFIRRIPELYIKNGWLVGDNFSTKYYDYAETNPAVLLDLMTAAELNENDPTFTVDVACDLQALAYAYTASRQNSTK